jgi:uncharacterized protein YjbI with pentapeptide repeats
MSEIPTKLVNKCQKASQMLERLARHKDWVLKKPSGVRLDLVAEDLSRYVRTALILKDSSLTRCRFTNADVSYSDFTDASLVESCFGGARLHEVNFTKANLTGASFLGASLEYSDFTGATITGASFALANLNGVTGLVWAAVGFNKHGECGRNLTAVVIDQVPHYYCGCFSGNQQAVLNYIKRDSSLEDSRMLALKTVNKLLLFSDPTLKDLLI